MAAKKSNTKFKPFYFDPDAPDTTARDQAHLDTNWAMANALRELIKIARHGSIEATYRQAIALGEELCPEFAPEQRMLHGARETDNARYIRQRAEAATILKGEMVTPMEIVEQMIADEKRNHFVNPDGGLITRRLGHLEAVREELKPKATTEHQVIFRDVFRAERELPITREGKNSVQYRIDEHRAVRIRVLHPDKPEHKLGADLIYEHLDTDRKVARVAHVQYKIWNKKFLYQDERMAGQCKKLQRMACNDGMCKSSFVTGTDYRLPNCAAFIRPTDRLQSPDAMMVSSGYHIPLCVVQKLTENQTTARKSIKKTSFEGKSLSHKTFEELFNSQMVGSIEIGFDQLQDFYDSIHVFDYEDTILIHAQEFTI